MIATIAPASSPTDLIDIARLFRAYAESLDFKLCFQGFDAELAGLPGKYASPAGALLIARGPNRAPLGCVAMRALDEPGICEMKRLYVAPAGRGQGLGRKLADAIVASAREAGYGEMRLDTLVSMTAARMLYASLGFREIDAYYDTPIRGTVFLSLTL